MKALIFFVLFLGGLDAYSRNLNSDTLKVIVQTKFGELTFKRICKSNKFEFVQSAKPIFDKEVEAEALSKNIATDTLKVAFLINRMGHIESFKIIKKSRIDRLNTFLSVLFNDAISELQNKQYTLNCNHKISRHIIPLIYVRQKPK